MGKKIESKIPYAACRFCGQMIQPGGLIVCALNGSDNEIGRKEHGNGI